jgi:hypothetical protein
MHGVDRAFEREPPRAGRKRQRPEVLGRLGTGVVALDCGRRSARARGACAGRLRRARAPGWRRRPHDGRRSREPANTTDACERPPATLSVASAGVRQRSRSARRTRRLRRTQPPDAAFARSLSSAARPSKRTPAVLEREQQSPPDTILPGPTQSGAAPRNSSAVVKVRSEARSRSRATPRTRAGCSRPRSAASASVRASGQTLTRRLLRTESGGRGRCSPRLPQIPA